MLMYGWMKFVEVAPQRYDWAVKVMTAGRLDRIKDLVADAVRPGERALDIGCGTGTLAVRCLKRGAEVTGLDSSEYMLGQALRNAGKEGLSERLTLVRDSVTQLKKHFKDQSFDVVMSTMALGEFPREYLDYILRDCRRLLKPSGRLIIADEVWPERLLPRILYKLGLVLLWVPQFVLLRRVLFPITDLKGCIEAAGFRVTRSESWIASSFKLLFAEPRPAALGGRAGQRAGLQLAVNQEPRR